MDKKIKALLASLFFAALCIIMVNTNVVEVQAEEIADEEDLDQYYKVIQNADGDNVYFPTENDYEVYIKNQTNNPNQRAIAIHYRETLVSAKRTDMKFVGYNKGTPAWTYADGYELSRGDEVSVSGSYEYSGLTFNLGFTKSYSTTTIIGADNKKLSRLAGYVDVTVRKYKIETIESGMVLATRYEGKKTIHNKYVLVKYK